MSTTSAPTKSGYSPRKPISAYDGTYGDPANPRIDAGRVLAELGSQRTRNGATPERLSEGMLWKWHVSCPYLDGDPLKPTVDTSLVAGREVRTYFLSDVERIKKRMQDIEAGRYVDKNGVIWYSRSRVIQLVGIAAHSLCLWITDCPHMPGRQWKPQKGIGKDGRSESWYRKTDVFFVYHAVRGYWRLSQGLHLTVECAIKWFGYKRKTLFNWEETCQHHPGGALPVYRPHKAMESGHLKLYPASGLREIAQREQLPEGGLTLGMASERTRTSSPILSKAFLRRSINHCEYLPEGKLAAQRVRRRAAPVGLVRWPSLTPALRKQLDQVAEASKPLQIVEAVQRPKASRQLQPEISARVPSFMRLVYCDQDEKVSIDKPAPRPPTAINSPCAARRKPEKCPHLIAVACPCGRLKRIPVGRNQTAPISWYSR